MSLSKQIAEAKRLNYQVIDGEVKICPPMMRGYTKTYDPETNKDQAMDLLIELIDKGWDMLIYKGKYVVGDLNSKKEGADKNPLIAICKAWLSAFGGGYDLLE